MNINDLPMIMVKCLVCTVIIETIIAFLLKIRCKKDLINVILVNIITNPIVVSLPFVFLRRYGFNCYRISFYTLEVITVLVEGFIYWRVLNNKKINPFLLSLILNASSYLIGELINNI